MSRLTVFLFLSVLSFSELFAGDFLRQEFLSKAGKFVDCNDGKGLQLLDLFEAKNQYFFTKDIPSGENEFKAAIEVFRKIEKIHPKRFAYYWAIIEHLFPKFMINLDGKIRLDGPKADSLYLPDVCEQFSVAKILFENLPNNELDVKIYIDSMMYQQLDFENKVALLVHLVVVFEGTSYEIIESLEGSRLYTGFLLSQEIKELEREPFLDFLSKIDYYNYLDTWLPPVF